LVNPSFSGVSVSSAPAAGYFGEADPCFGDIDPLAENGSKNR